MLASDAQQIKDIYEWFRGTIETRSLNECVMFINIGAPIELYDEVILAHTFNQCLNDSDQISALSMGTLQILSRALCLTEDPQNMEAARLVGYRLLDEIKRRLDQVTSAYFHVSLISIVRNLTRIDVYDVELMQNLFRKDYLQFIYRKSRKLELPLYEIDGYNRINLKHIYRYDFVPDEYLDNMKYLQDFIPDRVKRFKKRHRFVYAMEDVIGGLFSQYRYAHVLPFHKHAGKVYE